MNITEEGFENYIDKMINGDAEAAYIVAYCYLNGEIVEKNNDLALKYLKVSASLGYIIAMYYMVKIYLGEEVDGLIMNRNYSKAIEWAKVLSWANMLYNVEPEEKRYIYPGKMEVAVYYIDSSRSLNEKKKGFIIMKELADMGFPDAQYYTALCYINAIGTYTDYNAAKQYAGKCLDNVNNDVYGNKNSFTNKARQLYYQL